MGEVDAPSLTTEPNYPVSDQSKFRRVLISKWTGKNQSREIATKHTRISASRISNEGRTFGSFWQDLQKFDIGYMYYNVSFFRFGALFAIQSSSH
jgi:hypothetical protein